MSKRSDPREILRALAETLDAEAVLRRFGKVSREELAALVRRAAEDLRDTAAEGTLRVDGAARGNPGPAGAGFVLETDGNTLARGGEFLGEATNNVAEYTALLLGLERASGLRIRRLRVLSDSELMVRQLNGHYKVKSPALQELYFRAVKAAAEFDRVTYEHVPREENREADRMANLAIDARGAVKI